MPHRRNELPERYQLSRCSRTAELLATSLGRLQSRLHALADPAGFILGHCSQNVQGEARCEWLVKGKKLDISIHQIGNERDVSGQPVQLRDQKRRLRLSGRAQSLGELRPIRPLARFDLDKRRHDGRAVLPSERFHCHLLRFEPEPAFPLPDGADPQIGDKGGRLFSHDSIITL